MTILAYNLGGLANRMKNIVSCFRLDPIVLVYWQNVENYDEKNYHLFNCPYYELFSYPFLAENLSQGEEYACYDSDKFLIGDDDGLPPNFAKFDNKCKKEYIYQDELNRNIDFEYERIPLNLRKIYSFLFRQIKLNEELQEKINSFYKSNLEGKNIVSVHIRSWNRDNEEGRQHLHDIEKFISKMNEYSDCCYFLTSDSQETIDMVKSRVKNVFTYNRITERNNSRINPEGLREDLIELYLLSKGDVLIGSYYSSYTEVAWYLMDCKKVDII